MKKTFGSLSKLITYPQSNYPLSRDSWAEPVDEMHLHNLDWFGINVFCFVMFFGLFITHLPYMSEHPTVEELSVLDEVATAWLGQSEVYRSHLCPI